MCVGGKITLRWLHSYEVGILVIATLLNAYFDKHYTYLVAEPSNNF